MISIIHKAEVTAFLLRLAKRSVVRDAELLETVGSIIEDVRQRGDDALIDYAARFDGVELTRAELRVSEETLRTSAAKADAKFLSALRRAIQNVRLFHEQQMGKSWEFSPVEGVQLGQRITPLGRVGVYVPGGTAAYPSSIVMNVVPAKVAGVERIIVATPPRTLAENPAVAATLLELNVTEVYAIGGAQAIAALAFGTDKVPSVDKIVGPGNKYVAAAKKLLFGLVGIDAIAGPSEIVIIADEPARPDFIAADLLAQAEHGEDASAILITASESLARAVAAEVQRQAESLPRREIVASSLKNYGAIVVLENLQEICRVANTMAPEHLEIVTADDDAIAAKIPNAGAIFFGAYTPEAVGDYLAGPNHVLPTSGTARFASALGVYDFMKRTSTLRYSAGAFNAVADSVSMLAQCEGLAGHARSATIRKQ